VLSGLAEHIGVVGLAVGVLLSLNAGRRLAMRLHDLELARRYGRRLYGLGFIVYVYMFLGFAVTFISIVATQLMSNAVKVFIGVLEGNIMAIVYSVIISAVSTVVGYIVFSRRYHNVERPLTREGKIALRGISIGESAVSKVRKSLDRFKLEGSRDKDEEPS